MDKTKVTGNTSEEEKLNKCTVDLRQGISYFENLINKWMMFGELLVQLYFTGGMGHYVLLAEYENRDICNMNDKVTLKMR